MMCELCVDALCTDCSLFLSNQMSSSLRNTLIGEKVYMEESLKMKLHAISNIREQVSCPWPTPARIPMDRNFSLR